MKRFLNIVMSMVMFSFLVVTPINCEYGKKYAPEIALREHRLRNGEIENRPTAGWMVSHSLSFVFFAGYGFYFLNRANKG